MSLFSTKLFNRYTRTTYDGNIKSNVRVVYANTTHCTRPLAENKG